MKLGTRIALGLGLAALIALVAMHGVASIAAHLTRAGWMLLWLIPLQALPIYLDVLGWRVLILGQSRVAQLFVIACIRQAVNRLLPVASVGGELVGVRLLRLRGTDGTSAASSVIVEIILGLFSQYLFLAIGILCLFGREGSTHTLRELLIGLAAGFPPLIVLILLLRNGRLFHRIEHAARRVLGSWLDGEGSIDRGARLDTRIQETFDAHRRIAASVTWQLAGLLAGCSETWLALRWLGHPVAWTDAIVLESVTQTARSVLFMVPGALGVQEAGLIGAGLLVGLGSDMAIALSFAKRMREILFGLPWLGVWQWIEGRALFARSSTSSPPPSAPRTGRALFARNFFRHPLMLGSIIPSSRFLIDDILRPVDWTQARLIVEYGPGVGTISTEVLRRMRPDACLIVLETNPDFVEFLRATLTDPRLRIVAASAETVLDVVRDSGHGHADYVISGVPFSTMPAATRERILRATHEVLAPHGSFLVFQFSARVLEDLRRIFGTVRRQFELRNILPAHIFFCRP